MSSALLIVAISAIAVTMTEALAIPSAPFPAMMDLYGRPYPQREIMFAGFYRPTRPSKHGQASGIYAQGNEMSGASYLREIHLGYLKPSQSVKPVQEVATSDAEAAPESQEVVDLNKHQTSQYSPDQPHSLPEDLLPANIPIKPTKPKKNRKGIKRPHLVEEEEEDEEEGDEEYDDDDDDKDENDEPIIPSKNKQRRQYYPKLNNFFPMVFSFPRSVSRRRGESGSGYSPGMVTAIANSYSTGKSGVASSVATAYGGSPKGKKQKRRRSDDK